MSELKDLIARVEGLSGVDREVDGELYVVANPQYRLGKGSFGQTVLVEDGYRWSLEDIVPHITSSTDAALAFADRVLPGWGLELTKGSGEGYRSCRIWPGTSFEANRTLTKFANAPTLPLAIILATLNAKVAV